jgi:predicted RND superfamily exporter protein
VRIDLSTSLVASIATGAGSDFAMHYLWYLKRATAEEVVRFVGPVMVVSTLLVAAGFAVLAAGQSQPLRMFGSLAALAMAGSALFTFLLVPALLRKVDRPVATGGGRVEENR